MTHVLKCHPEPFAALRAGIKNYEIRQDDRGFKVGDVLDLREYIPDAGGRYTGKSEVVDVTYISRGPDWGLPVGLVVLGVRRLTPLV